MTWIILIFSKVQIIFLVCFITAYVLIKLIWQHAVHIMRHIAQEMESFYIFTLKWRKLDRHPTFWSPTLRSWIASCWPPIFRSSPTTASLAVNGCSLPSTVKSMPSVVSGKNLYHIVYHSFGKLNLEIKYMLVFIKIYYNSTHLYTYTSFNNICKR